jgi:lipoprotein NlpD
MRVFFSILITVFIIGCGTQSPVSVLSLNPHTHTISNAAIYIVKPKDTLHSISRDTGINYFTLVRLNKIQPPFTIYVGQRLLLRDNVAVAGTKVTTMSSSVIHASSPIVKEQARTQPENTVSKFQKNPIVKNQTLIAKEPIITKTINTQRNPQHIDKQQANVMQAMQKNKLQWGWPARGPVLGKFAVGSTKKKNGVDIGGNAGLLIKAAAAGKVVYSGSGLRGYGNLIIIKHNNNFLSAYAHNRKNIVAEGAEVRLGQNIAEMGNTGTNKVMLHFEIRYNGVPIDPEKLLPRK